VGLDDAALRAAYQRLEKPMFNVLYRWLWDPAECMDAMHDAFLRVWSRREQVRVDGLDALLYATALNLARNRRRWRALWRHDPADPQAAAPGEDPSAFAQRRADEGRVRDALGVLSAAQRDVVVLSEFSGLSTREIAAVLGIPEGTVGSRKHVALARLRALLESGDA
jgi:RNA polymerase sigma-70 factor (ECF subfamily)